MSEKRIKAVLEIYMYLFSPFNKAKLSDVLSDSFLNAKHDTCSFDF